MVEENNRGIKALEHMNGSIFCIGFNVGFETTTNGLKEAFAPLLDGSFDISDLETFFENYWNSFGQRKIKILEEMCSIQRRLESLYKRLADASEEELGAYFKLIIVEGSSHAGRFAQRF